MLTGPVRQTILAALALATVAVAQNSPTDGSFQVRYAANLTRSLFSAIYVTGEIPPVFNPGGAYASLTTASPACAPGTIAMQFTAVATLPLQQITLPLFSISSPVVTSATVQVMTNTVGNAPGAVLDTLTFTGITNTPTLITATSTATPHPILTAGTVYWLQLVPPACALTTQEVDWNVAIPFVAGSFSINGGSATSAPGGLAAMFIRGLFTPDSLINITNTGANNAGDICVNTYVFSPDEQLVACCACKVTRNALYSGGVNRDLLALTLTPAVENSVVIKLLATAAPTGNCNPATPGPPVQGMAAWGTTLHSGFPSGAANAPFPSGAAFGGETPFTNASLSAAEQTVMSSYCGFIQSNGSGYGICKFCQTNTAPPSSPNLGLGPDDNTTFRKGLGGNQQ